MSSINHLSSYNQKVLSDYAEKIGGRIDHLSPQEKKASFSFWDSIASLLPSAKQSGQAVGYAAAVTHGPALSNRSIDFICKRVFETEKSTSWSSWFSSAILGLARPTVAEMAKLTITPKLLPVLQILGVAAGGLTAQGVVALASVLYGRIMNAKDTSFSLANLPSIDQLLAVDKETGRIIDANGNELTEEDLKDIKTQVLRYDTICKFLDSDKDSLDRLLAKFLMIRSDNWEVYYKDGMKVTEDDLKAIEEGYNTLMRANPMEKTKAIRAMIKKLSSHPKVEKQGSEIDRKYIVCQDGTRCTDEGLVVSLEEYERETREHEAFIENEVNDFHVVDRG